jgi:hypothetical protein
MKNSIFIILIINLIFILSCESDELEKQPLEFEVAITNNNVTTSKSSDSQNRAIACALTYTFHGSATDLNGNPWIFNGEKTFRFEWNFDPSSCNFGTTYDVSIEFRTNPFLQCVGNSGSVTSQGSHSTGLSYFGNQVYYYNPVGDIITDKIFEYRTVITLKHCTVLNGVCTITSA